MEATAENTNHEYLGDGVYASFDGRQVWLDLRGQDDTTAIAMEPEVLEALFRYAGKVAGIQLT